MYSSTLFLDRGGADTRVEAVYLSKHHISETGIASKLKRLIQAPKSIRAVDTDKSLAWIQRTYPIEQAKVMQIKNNHDKDFINGDIGRIIGLDLDGKR